MTDGSPTLIYCADGNARFAEIAIRHGYKYGAQLPNTVYFAPHFTDQNWREPNRAAYMAALARYRPALATVLDWERDDQLGDVLAWAEEAAQYVGEAVIVIPKVMSGIVRLPRCIGGRYVRLGYSVPTRFAGTQVPVWEFVGWPVHLLGGSPQRQLLLARYLDVRSADGNMAVKMAHQYCKHFDGRRWTQIKGVARGDDAPYKAFELSCRNIQIAWKQLRTTP